MSITGNYESASKKIVFDLLILHGGSLGLLSCYNQFCDSFILTVSDNVSDDYLAGLYNQAVDTLIEYGIVKQKKSYPSQTIEDLCLVNQTTRLGV